MAYAQWPREKFLARLRERVTEKLARATRLKGGPFPGGYLILIHTDEPLLSSAKVSEYLMGIEHPALKGVARAFLLVSYEPAHARCPYFELASEA